MTKVPYIPPTPEEPTYWERFDRLLVALLFLNYISIIEDNVSMFSFAVVGSCWLMTVCLAHMSYSVCVKMHRITLVVDDWYLHCVKQFKIVKIQTLIMSIYLTVAMIGYVDKSLEILSQEDVVHIAIAMFLGMIYMCRRVRQKK